MLLRIKKIASVLTLLFILGAPSMVFAQLSPTDINYTPLVPLPGINKQGTSTLSLNTYIPGMFNLTIGIAGVLAVLMIVFGGVEYITSESLGGKSNGRDRINNAIIGLVLIIGSYAILATINPKSLQFDLSGISTPPSGEANTPINTVVLTGEDAGKNWFSDEIERGFLYNEGFKHGVDGKGVNKLNCKKIGDQNCTSVYGLGDKVILGLSALNKACGRCVEITGGTEYWLHGRRSTEQNTSGTRHIPGGNVVDISLNHGALEFFRSRPNLKSNAGGCAPGSERYEFAGGLYVNEQIPGNPPHFHVCFGSGGGTEW